MKDYYDIYYLANNYDFNGAVIRKAIAKTLEKRGTPIDRATLNVIANIHKDDEMNRRWSTFTGKTLGVELEFHDVVNLIVQFLVEPSISIIEEKVFDREWSARLSNYTEKGK